MTLPNCPVCNTENLDFSIRCISCGSFLQQNVKTLDLFSTIYNIWRNPVFTLRRIILAEHKNYTVLIAALEAIGLSFLSLFIVKAADIYSLELWRIIAAGTGLGIVVFLPAIYLFLILSYLILRPGKRGVTLKGFISGTVYSMHPLAFGTAVFLPADVAVFGPYIFSNNPSPQVINPLPFYFLGFLDLAAVVASVVFMTRLVHIMFGTKIRATLLSAVFLCVFAAALEVAKQLLLK
ncbi:MAG: hypothetical protein M1469_03990 [Bacteroidetes bacterium]|nr:hypothetical protein [Bacteroidota bacterium]